MFTITYVAGDYLTELLDTANASEETAVRFVVENNTLTPKLDTARPGDATFDHEGRTVLVLDSSVAHAMADSTAISGTGRSPGARAARGRGGRASRRRDRGIDDACRGVSPSSRTARDVWRGVARPTTA